MTNDGFIRIYRNEDDDLYFRDPFTRWQAWIDLIMLAYPSDSELYVRGIRIEAKRGCVYIGTRDLAERWQWSRGKVIRFLENLICEHKIVPQTRPQNKNVIACISITNYDKYLLDDTTNETTNGTTEQKKEKKVTKKIKEKNTSDNDKNKNKEISVITLKKKEELSIFGPSEEEANFDKWMKEKFPYVSKMKRPLTLPEIKKLQNIGYTNKEITQVLSNMDNWSKLNTYVYAYQTLLNWLKRDYGERHIATT